MSLLLFSGSCFGADAETVKIDLHTSEGIYGMINRPWPESPDATPVPLAVSVRGADHPVNATLTASDIFEHQINWKQTLVIPPDGKPRKIPFPAHHGFFAIKAQLKSGQSKTLGIGIIPPPHSGVRPESFFASNTSGLKTGKDLEFLEAIGLKIQRVHFQPEPNLTKEQWLKPPDGKALPVDYSAQDKLFAEGKAHGLWVLPVAGYALNPAFGRTELATRLGMWGPPRDDREFVSTWEQTLRHYPEVTTYEFWNEPWIFGWTWAGTPADYRKLQKMWCDMALKVNPNLRIIAGNSSLFFRDNIAPFPDSYQGLLQGVSHHPYTRSVDDTTFRSGDNRRSIDDGMDATKRAGLPYYYLTEGGTIYKAKVSPERAVVEKRLAEILARRRDFVTPEQQKSPEALALDKENTALVTRLAELPEPADNIENASKIVQYYVNAALVGAFMGNAQWEIGYGPRWTRSNTSFAVMTRLLEDRPIAADIWPEQQLITGAIFAPAKCLTPEVKELPRAGDLGVRWNVPVPSDRRDDQTKVAVIWSLTGGKTLDTDGHLVIEDSGDIKAYDLTGRPIPANNGRITVPFGPNPVFLTTEKMDIVAFRDKLTRASLENVTPVNAYALSLTQPADQAQQLTVRIQNQINRDIEGKISLRIEGRAEPITVPFSIAAGKLGEVRIPWPGAKPDSNNQYVVGIRMEAGDKLKPFEMHQIVEQAAFVKRTIKVDGMLDDWEGSTPVYIDSAQFDGSLDLTGNLLNPGTAVATGGKGRITARVYTAYDDANIYLAMAVNEPALNCTVGEPVIKGRRSEKVTLPFKSGVPDGLKHVTECGDVFQFAFGFRDRVPQAGRQIHDSYAWKGSFYDTDYCYAAYAAKEGAEVMRLYGPDTPRCNGYQTEAVPGIGSVRGAQIKIRRDEGKGETLYEMSVPRSEVAMFDPKAGRLRFGFKIFNDEKIGMNSSLSWSEAAGVFDYWSSAGSFPPNWISSLPCQTFFGIDGSNHSPEPHVACMPANPKIVSQRKPALANIHEN